MLHRIRTMHRFGMCSRWSYWFVQLLWRMVLWDIWMWFEWNIVILQWLHSDAWCWMCVHHWLPCFLSFGMYFGFVHWGSHIVVMRAVARNKFSPTKPIWKSRNFLGQCEKSYFLGSVRVGKSVLVVRVCMIETRPKYEFRYPLVKFVFFSIDFWLCQKYEFPRRGHKFVLFGQWRLVGSCVRRLKMWMRWKMRREEMY